MIFLKKSKKGLVIFELLSLFSFRKVGYYLDAGVILYIHDMSIMFFMMLW